MDAATPYKVHTSQDVLEMFPDALRPSREQLEAVAGEYGCYHDCWGIMGFTDGDIDELFDYIRAIPKDADAPAVSGPSRLFRQDWPKTEAGYMVLIGDQLRESDAVFVGFSPSGGAGDLLRLVQFGNPGNLVILGYFAATVADVDAYRAALSVYQHRADDTNWYTRTNAVDAYFAKLREQVYGATDETDQGDI